MNRMESRRGHGMAIIGAASMWYERIFRLRRQAFSLLIPPVVAFFFGGHDV